MPRKTKRKRPLVTPKHPDVANDLPTRKHLDTVKAWKRLAKGGDPPTTRELAAELGISQTAVQWRLNQCEERGLLVRPIVQVPGPLQLSPEGEKWIALAV